MFTGRFPPIILLKKTTALGLLMISLSACAATLSEEERQNAEPDVEAQVQVREATGTSADDPFEDINRRIFVFNYRLDRWLLKPVAEGYDALTPAFLQTGVSNFFSNLGEVTDVANDILQWKWKKAGNDSGRFLINSTIGLVGLFDVAAKAGLAEGEGEDFGQTLAVWGVGRGPYLMLPIFGPSTLRDAPARLVDTYTDPLTYVEPWESEYGLRFFEIIDERAAVLETESLLTGDSYTLLRDFYLQRRHYLIKDGRVEDTFGEDYGGDGYYDDYGYGEEEADAQ